MSWIKDMIWNNTEGEAPLAAEPPRNTTPSTNGGSVDAEMIAAIKKATLTRKTPYTALLEASDKLISVIADVTTRLKAAYAMVGTESRSIDQISKAVDLHIADVDGEVMRFSQATKNKRASEIGGLQDSINTGTADLERLIKELTGLQTRVQETQATIDATHALIHKATAEMQAKGAEITQIEEKFKAAAKQVRDELDQQRRVILSTLR